MTAPITADYLLCLNVPSYRDNQGRRYLDPLWHKDLLQHAGYLTNLTLAAPCRQSAPPADAIEWSPSNTVRFIDLKEARSTLHALRLLPCWTARLWQAIGAARIVHTGVAGWPLPLGWLATPIARLRRKPVVMIVESAPWRMRTGVRAALFETLARWCIRHAALVIYTHDNYRTSLPARTPQQEQVIAASWLDEGDLLTSAAAAETWRIKRTANPLRLLYAGRLHPDKGILTALEAIGRSPAAVHLDILGAGPLQPECAAAASRLSGRVTFLGTLPYGPAFFQHLRTYHALVVPSLSDEQPRVVYDAFSQALPVLASNTAGLSASIRQGETGMLAPMGDAAAWADLFQWSLEHSANLETMGLTALETARNLTHTRMHHQRAQLLRLLLAETEQKT